MTKQCCNHGDGDSPSTTVVGLLERPLYAPGLILEDADLTAGVDYTRQLNRLLFRSLFGCGVICGLTVEVKEDCGLQVTVTPGLALDGCGDPIQVPRPATLTLTERHDVIRKPQQETSPLRRNFWVTLCGGEKRCRPRSLVCDADEMEGANQQTRARAQAEIVIAFEPPVCSCGCYEVDVVTSNSPANYHVYDALADRYLPRQAAGGAQQMEHQCQERHDAAVACAPDCGCDSGCDCCLVIAWVHWYPAEKAWGVLHNGVRRLIRPTLNVDPVKDMRPAPGAAGS